jgi:hypothetical protein
MKFYKSPRLAAGDAPSASKRLRYSGGQYTNTGKLAQEKHLQFWFRARFVSRSMAGAALYELIQQKPGQPLLIVPNNSAVM